MTEKQESPQPGAAHRDEQPVGERKLATYLDASTARALKTYLGIETVGDFLEFYPRKYLARGELTPFSELVQGQEATLLAKVLRVRTRSMRARRGSITEVLITDRLDSADHQRARGHGQGGRSQAYRADYRYAPAAEDQPNTAHPRIAGSAAPGDPAGSGSLRGHDVFGHGAGTIFDGSLPLNGSATGQQSTMTLSFFNAWTAAREIHEGDQVMFSGKVGAYRGELTLTNPHYAVLAENLERSDNLSEQAIARARARAGAPIPVYRASAKLPTDRIASAMEELLLRAPLHDLEDPVPADIRARRKIPGLAQTYRDLHTPDSEEAWRAAQHFLRYREAFVLQAALARIRAHRAASPARARPPVEGGFAQKLSAVLPYRLTEGQQRVGEQISGDLASTTPMNRLLQGDVGSGKTVVALRAVLQVVDNGAQAAMLAPTEVLAEQHFRSVTDILGDLVAESGGAEVFATGDDTLFGSAVEPGAKNTVRVVLLKAAMPARAKKRVLLEIATGAADIVIGTHALLADTVSFADLGMVVVDEQHRFGVEQRDSLRGPGGILPHRLVMTATPIPRTVAMTIFGDLDISVLDQLPQGRQKIHTVVVPLAEHPGWERRLWGRAREEIDAGHQVYVVVPKIGGGDVPESVEEGTELWGAEPEEPGELNSVTSMMDDLTHMPVLAGARIAALHGRMGTEEKTAVMRQFEQGRIDLLVCTTVIEVGVNVPNATLMVVMDADRFGISGLHQLRGRIGRGNLAATCLLVTGQGADGVSRQRLDAVAATTDGFELSRVDLVQRREGDILGAAQSGKKSALKLLRVLKDAPLIEKARDDARQLVDGDPALALHPVLANTIDRALDADREAFLGRG